MGQHGYFSCDLSLLKKWAIGNRSASSLAKIVTVCYSKLRIQALEFGGLPYGAAA